jgi:hypothetical protein
MKSILVFAVFCFGLVSLVGSCSSARNLSSVNSVSSQQQATLVAFCDIPERAEKLNGQRIITAAILIAGQEYAYLYDPTCSDEKHFVYYRFISDAVGDKFNDFFQADNNPEYKTVGVMRVKALFHGILETGAGKGLGPDGFAKYNLTIEDAEDIQSAPRDAPYPW